ncbi:hypothetical protein M409DRAFT_57146 [Zasmidium cellare ATCC 36951]|uniref:Transcription factor domain-containing protein n=1 Tax=Zasmidium cellare ATCC 36951 TaxID=1080233 RepID=A0A6A6CD76_ZASCE|nr:uncharacterized protein M409DRAFT_57146 [Zasmidium cellare ATCC 36951]KAF2163639.1 hypothetical protein M409DRAFT_57146 [Zasmidium cellare ATCC 36951]
MSASALDAEQQLRLALLDLMPAPHDPHNASNASGLRIPHLIPVYEDEPYPDSGPAEQPPGRPLQHQLRSTPVAQSDAALKTVEQSHRDRVSFLESEGNRVNPSELPSQSLPSRDPGLEREEQSELPSSSHASSHYTLIRAAERLEKLARSFRRQAATAVDAARDQHSRVVQPRGSVSKQKPVRHRAASHEVLNIPRLSDGRHVAASSMSAGADPVQRIKSPTVNLDGLYTKFLDLYLPRNPKGNTATAVLSLLLETPNVLPSPVPALEEAVRTLVLVSLGGATGDHALLQQGVKHYGKSLSSLRKSIANPQVTHYEHTFVAIMILLMCSHHTKIRTVDNGWVQHIQSWALWHSRWLDMLLSATLLTRKASCFAKTTEYEPTANDFRLNWSVLLFNTSLQIPALLERHDAIMLSNIADLNRVEALDSACSGAELRLRSWFNEWTAIQTTLGNVLFKEQSIERFTPFSTLCKNRTFTSAYWFQDFSYAFHAVWYCISMHYVLQTRLSLEALRQELTKNRADPKIDRAAYRSEAFQIARDICMCIPFLCQEQCGMSGYIAMLLPLRVVTVYFLGQGSSDCLQWTDELMADFPWQKFAKLCLSKASRRLMRRTSVAQNYRVPALETKADLAAWHINHSNPNGSKIDDPEVAINVPAEFSSTDETFVTTKNA